LSNSDSAQRLRGRLRGIGLSEPLINAAWPTWWSEAADASASARTELRFSVARKLGLDPHSLLEDSSEPRFIWRDEARFKHLAGEGELEKAALTSFGRAVSTLLLPATPVFRSIQGTTAAALRKSVLGTTRPFIQLVDMLSLCWAVGIPVVHLRVFPWPQKRMAAMTVRVGDRWTILIGKDSEYPAHIAFYLAHEIAHIALQHISEDQVIVDLETDEPLDSKDDEERSADRYALEVLTGTERPTVLPEHERYSARELARVALQSAATLGIEPGTLALCFGYSTNDWAVANAAMPHIYEQAKPVWREINSIAKRELLADRIPDDAVEYLAAILGETA
jgi:hypothetical protein